MPIYSKVYNMLLNENGLDPDKYEREDAFMSIIHEIDEGKEPGDAFSEVFEAVHGVIISDIIVRSRIEMCKGLED